LTLNFLVWGSVAWAGIWRREDNHFVNACANTYHFANYVVQDAQLLQRAGGLGDATQQYRMYLFTRAAVFFTTLRSSEQLEQRGIDAGVFVTNTLLSLRSSIISSAPNFGAYRDTFGSIPEVKNFENALLKNLREVDNAYSQIFAPYAEAQKTIPVQVQSLVELRNANTPYIVVQVAPLQDYLVVCLNKKSSAASSAPVNNDDDADSEDEEDIDGELDGEDDGEDDVPAAVATVLELPYYEHFFTHLKRIRAAKFLSSAVFFYQQLYRFFGNRITLEQTSLSFPECLHLLRRFEPSDAIQVPLLLWLMPNLFLRYS